MRFSPHEVRCLGAALALILVVVVAARVQGASWREVRRRPVTPISILLALAAIGSHGGASVLVAGMIGVGFGAIVGGVCAWEWWRREEREPLKILSTTTILAVSLLSVWEARAQR